MSLQQSKARTVAVRTLAEATFEINKNNKYTRIKV